MRKVIRKHFDLNLKFVSLESFIACFALQVLYYKEFCISEISGIRRKSCVKLDLMMCPHFQVCENWNSAVERTYQIVIKNFHIWWQICIWAIKFYMHKLVMWIFVGVCETVREWDSVGWDTKWEEMSSVELSRLLCCLRRYSYIEIYVI